MSSIQGVGPSTAAPYVPAKAPVAPAVKSEAQETARDERAEANRGAQEPKEAQATNPNLGTRLSVTA